MHNRLETYLTEMSDCLRPLPLAKRQEELREVTAHLESAVAAIQESGMPESEAVNSVLEQFGAPEVVGRDVLSAWRRGRTLDRRSFWGAAVCDMIISVGSSIILRPLIFPVVKRELQAHHHLGFWAPVELVEINLTMCVLVGLTIGSIFPKKAIAGLVFSNVCLNSLNWLWFALMFVYNEYIRVPHCLMSMTNMGIMIAESLVWSIVYLSITILVAWMASRWRTRGVFARS